MRVKVEGAKQLDQIARVLEAQGNSKALKRRMTKAFRRAAEPITRDQKRNLATELPKRGGAAATIGSESRTTVRTNAAKATVDIIDSWPGHNIKAIDHGILRHPTFEHYTRAGVVGAGPGEWHVTHVKPLLLTQPFEDHKETVRAELLAEMDVLAVEIARET